MFRNTEQDTQILWLSPTVDDVKLHPQVKRKLIDHLITKPPKIFRQSDVSYATVYS